MDFGGRCQTSINETGFTGSSNEMGRSGLQDRVIAGEHTQYREAILASISGSGL